MYIIMITNIKSKGNKYVHYISIYITLYNYSNNQYQYIVV